MKNTIEFQQDMFAASNPEINKIELSDLTKKEMVLPGKKEVSPRSEKEPVKPYSDGLKALSKSERLRLFPKFPPDTMRELMDKKRKK